MQCTGAVFGSFFARSVSPTLFASVGGAANVINPSGDPRIGLGTVLGGEVIGTALLVFTISAAADAGRERSNRYVGALTPLMIGFSVTLVHFFLIPIDNCSINPARSLGSAVVQGGKQAWSDHWVFWAGPLVGGPFSALLYEFVFSAMATSTANADDTKDKTARNELISAAEDAIQRVPSIEGEQVSSMSSSNTERETTSSNYTAPPSTVQTSPSENQVFQIRAQQVPDSYIPVQKPLSPIRDVIEMPPSQATTVNDSSRSGDATQELPVYTMDTSSYSADDSFDASGPPPISEEERRKYD